MANPEREEHYFSDAPTVASSPVKVTLALPDVRFELLSDRGVFSAAHVDPGTKLLLLEAPAPPSSGSLLDLGCGYGPVALTLASRSPGATVWAIDVNERARDLTSANAAAAGLAVRVVAPGDVPDHERFAVIWSNPPIRIGKTALHELLVTWLDRLEPSGHAYLVVQKHLGADSLAAWLVGRGHVVRRVRSRMGYRILEVAAR